MDVALPRHHAKSAALKTPYQVEAAEEVLADPFQSLLLLRMRSASKGREAVAGPQLIAWVDEIAAKADVEVTTRQLRNRLRGMIRKGLVDGDEDGSVKLTADGSAVAGALSSNFVA